ncbi:hypothetical protein [Streptomyces sp. NBC_00354]|uniref:hypothetical protein n=1 Tax=Streptomyces sp. NBC_00354 TaxID=2975723 RepID=UPI002E2669CA
MTQGRCCRAVRAAMFAATCVLLASLAHILMTGTAVPWWAVAAASGATGALAWFLAAYERGLLAVISATVAVQAALHTGFSLAQAAAAPSAPGGAGTSLARRWAGYLLCEPAGGSPLHAAEPVHTAGHAHHAAQAMTDGSTALQMPMQMPLPVRMPVRMAVSAGHDMGSMSPGGMLAAHLLAALLCGLWLAYGERGAFRVLRAVAGLLLVPLRPALRLPAPPHRPRLRARRGPGSRRLRGLLLVHAITSRGPPLGTAVS